MKLILRYLKKYKLLFFFNLLAVFCFALVELGIPTIMANMINVGIANQDIRYIQNQGLLLLGIAVIGGLGTVLLNYTSSRIATRITRDIRSDMFEKSQEFGHSEYNEFGVSSLITRLSGDVYQLQLFVQMLLRMGLHSPFMILFSGYLIYRTNPTLALIISLSVPFILLVVVIVGKLSGPLSRKQQKLMDTLSRITRENITGVRVIRAFRKDKSESERFEKVNKEYETTAKRLYRVMARAEPLFFFILEISVLVILWFASVMVSKGTLEVGSIVAFLEYQFHALFSLLLFSVVFIQYPRAAVSARRIEEVLNKEPMIQNPENGVHDGNGITEVVFENVDFAYPDGEANVLTNINFTAKKGETVAFIGSTGSGKSTLINLIVRFYDVTNGRVLVDGVDVREYDIYSLRNKVGFIPQKALLFSGSISQNIRYGKELATSEEIEESAQLASASDFIHEKPHQYEEWLSEGGSNVSGGQKQRLSIARALVRKPEIYIFDDSFSALDYKTDAMIRKNLKDEVQDSIMFVVAQRISSIVDADQIIVMNEGKIVGKGTHLELMKECPIYVQIAKSQLSEKEMEQYEKL
ncbi:ABC transporter ATP-binding protein [Erysipelothrix inopinata]|uniref:ABC transporter ATP-binding protein n=1 Tax=Erysipelothrix inopinata TaxID=225084 RepID=A0A7G9S177_9FIRM|nr:ABC transporter ATP-binding protein [Erysipelothrix inopinata]QNN61602.1 ABC transporter ATP-binding protein [Erysipelothrix inopinata]